MNKGILGPNSSYGAWDSAGEALPEQTEQDRERARLAQEFDFSDQVVQLYNLECRIRDLELRQQQYREQLNSLKQQLPREIIELYERDLVVRRLQGSP